MSWRVTSEILKSFGPDRINDQLYVICDKCKFEERIAYGWDANLLTIRKRIAFTKMIGWQAYPQLLCRKCLYLEA